MKGFSDLKKNDDLLIGMSLTVIILTAYWQVQYCDLIDYDDISYIINNRHVKSGLSWNGFTWAMTDIHTGYWHPLTWLSHMLDYQLFGSNAGGHHWTSLIIHAANAIVLYILLKRTTGDVLKSAFVASIFAVHPLNVESVAWVAERKNVLSTFFCFTALWSYACYLEKPGGYKYCLVILLFSLGLMAKPILVTFPFLLLLFDYWPLYRLNSWKDLCRLFFEKIPFFILAFIISVVTILAARHEGSVISLDVLPVWDRVANVLISYVTYLGKVFWPENLAVFYPFVRIISSFQMMGAALILIVISCFVIVLAKRYRYALVGWFWYLGILVPVIGLVQAGEQAMADRYAYVPAIGLFIITAWGAPDLFRKWWPKQKMIYMAFAGAILFAFIICTFYQVKHWHNSITLFGHALQVTHGNYLAHNNLGVALLNKGRVDEAEEHFEMAIEIKPDYSAAYNNMGLVLASLGKLHEAMSHYNMALKINQNDGKAHDNMGIALTHTGKFDEAMKHFQEALTINPENADAYNNMGSLLARRGKVSEALGYFERALQLDGDHAMANNNMGVALVYLGRLHEAADHFARALNVSPGNRDAYNNLNAVLKKINNTKEISAHP